MPKILLTDRAGQESTIDAANDQSLMQNILDAGHDEMLAMCGGCKACATCHVYIDAPTELLGEASFDETELLTISDHLTEHSRLSCQIIVNDNMDGLRVTMAPED